LAFLLSAAWYFAYGGMQAGQAAAALLGAFLGGLLATGVNERLWEDNAPPSAGIRDEVARRHSEIIGAPPPAPRAKRLFDVLLALAGLILSTPLWLTCAFLLWLEDPGPLLFVKNSVGKGGVNFRQLKFRTMVREAEHATGPVLASEDDARVLAVGRILRKAALDELPQLVNILRGEMSFVGPRPQRTVLVHGYLEDIPAYAERHRVAPGLAGLAQVVGDYYLTPLQKLRFDRLYIRHASLGLDIKLILLAFLIAFWFRWQKDWNGRLPRRMVRWGGFGGE
ncbi:MAG: sugar transferase, partial [Chloroflexi bacterium]|nr:sugar transferase [Chloroflexota bacterium]